MFSTISDILYVFLLSVILYMFSFVGDTVCFLLSLIFCMFSTISVKSQGNIVSFRRHLKTYLFNAAYPP